MGNVRQDKLQMPPRCHPLAFKMPLFGSQTPHLFLADPREAVLMRKTKRLICHGAIAGSDGVAKMTGNPASEVFFFNR